MRRLSGFVTSPSAGSREASGCFIVVPQEVPGMADEGAVTVCVRVRPLIAR